MPYVELTETQILNLRIIDLEKAMQNFVDRVDKGEVRSIRTYNQFKELLKQ